MASSRLRSIGAPAVGRDAAEQTTPVSARPMLATAAPFALVPDAWWLKGFD
jgi:hypothetical protein